MAHRRFRAAIEDAPPRTVWNEDDILGQQDGVRQFSRQNFVEVDRSLGPRPRGSVGADDPDATLRGSSREALGHRQRLKHANVLVSLNREPSALLYLSHHVYQPL